MLWYNVFSFFIIVICIFLILIVLVQNSKGGGLASGFTSSNQYMGVRKTADFLEKATWTLASGLLLLCIVSSIALRASGESSRKSAIEEQVRNQEGPASMPAMPNQNQNQKTTKKVLPVGPSREHK
jgi:preprotein translocase subunit SecG